MFGVFENVFLNHAFVQEERALESDSSPIETPAAPSSPFNEYEEEALASQEQEARPPSASTNHSPPSPEEHLVSQQIISGRS